MDNEHFADELFRLQNRYINDSSNDLNCLNDGSDDFSEFSQRDPYSDSNGQNNDDIINTRNNNIFSIDNSSYSQEENHNNLNLPEINEGFDFNQNKLTIPTTETIHGKTFITSSNLIDKNCIDKGNK